MQGDGNLCLRGGSGSGYGWCNHSNGPVGDYYMILRDTGSLDIYRGTPANYGASTLVWTTLLDAAYYNGRYLTAEMAGAAKNSNSTVAIVADQRRSVYKMAGRPNAYQERVNALNEKPERR